MSENNLDQTLDLMTVAGEIVSAYVSNNNVPPAELPALIGNVHAALQALLSNTAVGSPAASAETADRPTAAQIRKSVTHDGIMSFVDGKVYKTLKRHLGIHGLNPHSYRAKYGLPPDYPMTAPSYSAARSQIAKSIGLGVSGPLAA